MHLNRFIIVAGLIIVGTSLYQLIVVNKASSATSAQGQIFSIVTGGWLFMVALSILDLFGGVLATLASGLALVAVVYVLLNNGFITGLFSGATSAVGTTGGGGGGGTKQ